MSTATSGTTGGHAPPEHPPSQANEKRSGLTFRGYGSLTVAGILALFTAYVVYGIFTMDVPESAQSPGPKLYPTILAVLSTAIVIGLVIDAVRNPEDDRGMRYNAPVGEEQSESTIPVQQTNKRGLAAVIGAFILFLLIMEPVGWIISATFLFWAFAQAIGGKSWLLNVAVGLVVACGIQVGFSMGLGLALPSGVLGGIF